MNSADALTSLSIAKAPCTAPRAAEKLSYAGRIYLATKIPQIHIDFQFQNAKFTFLRLGGTCETVGQDSADCFVGSDCGVGSCGSQGFRLANIHWATATRSYCPYVRTHSAPAGARKIYRDLYRL